MSMGATASQSLQCLEGNFLAAGRKRLEGASCLSLAVPMCCCDTQECPSLSPAKEADPRVKQLGDEGTKEGFEGTAPTLKALLLLRYQRYTFAYSVSWQDKVYVLLQLIAY